MQCDHPHEIRHFKDGEPVPGNLIPLTAAEAQRLERMTVDERAEWLQDRGRQAKADLEYLVEVNRIDSHSEAVQAATRRRRPWLGASPRARSPFSRIPKRGLECKGGARVARSKRKPKKKGGRR